MSTVQRDYFGTFRVLKMLSYSTTCLIFEAIHDMEHRRVALKVLKDQFCKDRSQVGQLKHEYLVGSQLNHERVLRVFEFNVDKNTPYIVSEICCNRNLKNVIQQGVDELAPMAEKIIKQALEGLQYFHAQGWVHRDVKPSNLLVNEEGDVKLIDFSIAQKQNAASLSQMLGMRGKVQGTRSFMPPEQIRGKPVDARADIYSFGCMMHVMFTGKPPYTAENANDLLIRHLRAPIPLLANSNHNISDEFSQYVGRFMAKHREERPESVDEILHELEKMNVFRKRPTSPK